MGLSVSLSLALLLFLPSLASARHHHRPDGNRDFRIATFDRLDQPAPARGAPGGPGSSPGATPAAAPASTGLVVLFDNTHAETAGNADWTVTGGYSDFADTLRHHGFAVRSLDTGRLDDAALAGVGVVVLPEPNSPLVPEELAALQKFVESGGGLLAIGDHGGSDRNRDGWDSVRVLNTLTPRWGITFNGDVLSQEPLLPQVATDITRSVTSAGVWAGSSLAVSGANTQVHFSFSQDRGGKPFLASAVAGKGRLVCMGDSSTFDDGTGEPGHRLYNAYSNPKYTIPQLALNIVDWLASRPFEAVGR